MREFARRLAGYSVRVQLRRDDCVTGARPSEMDHPRIPRIPRIPGFPGFLADGALIVCASC